MNDFYYEPIIELLKELPEHEYVYIYESHMGYGIYTSNEYLSYDYLYCETCGDSDMQLDSGIVGELLIEYENKLKNNIG